MERMKYMLRLLFTFMAISAIKTCSEYKSRALLPPENDLGWVAQHLDDQQAVERAVRKHPEWFIKATPNVESPLDSNHNKPTSKEGQ
jgi:hypothetical protein